MDFKNKLQPFQRILALDIGSKSMGVALSDMTRKIATPHSIINRRGPTKDCDNVISMVNSENVGAIVMGLPLSLDGTENKACAAIREFAKAIQKKKKDIPIIFQDERFSTKAAQRALRDANVKRKARDELDDKVAAAYILQGVLDKL